MMLRVSGSTICTSHGVENRARCVQSRRVAVEVIEGTEANTIIAKHWDEVG